jgi:hypothetical protein
VALAALAALAAGCGAPGARLRLVSSLPRAAVWSFVVDDRGRGAELLIDGRTRAVGCDRAGSELRCELRGLWPGGHTVELRLPGAVLRRSVVLGREWPTRPLLVRARSTDEVAQAGEHGADGVVLDAAGQAGPPPSLELVALVDAAHKHGVRALVAGPAELVETAGADGVVGGALPPPLARRFPEARAFAVGGLLETHGLVGGARGLAAPTGAIVDAAAFPLLDARKRHAALRDGAICSAASDGPRWATVFGAGPEVAWLLVNEGATPWRFSTGLADPLDLLGGRLEGGASLVAPHDVALVVPSPQPDRTRY